MCHSVCRTKASDTHAVVLNLRSADGNDIQWLSVQDRQHLSGDGCIVSGFEPELSVRRLIANTCRPLKLDGFKLTASCPFNEGVFKWTENYQRIDQATTYIIDRTIQKQLIIRMLSPIEISYCVFKLFHLGWGLKIYLKGIISKIRRRNIYRKWLKRGFFNPWVAHSMVTFEKTKTHAHSVESNDTERCAATVIYKSYKVICHDDHPCISLSSTPKKGDYYIGWIHNLRNVWCIRETGHWHSKQVWYNHCGNYQIVSISLYRVLQRFDSTKNQRSYLSTLQF